MRVVKPELDRPELLGAQVVISRFSTDAEECFDARSPSAPAALVTCVDSGEELFVYFDEIDLLRNLPATGVSALVAQLVLDASKANSPDWHQALEGDLRNAGDCRDLGEAWMLVAFLHRSIINGWIDEARLCATGLSASAAAHLIELATSEDSLVALVARGRRERLAKVISTSRPRGLRQHLRAFGAWQRSLLIQRSSAARPI
jgi:hypothetical protein